MCIRDRPWTVWSLTLGQRRAEVLVPHSTPHELWRLLVMLGVAFVAVVVPLEIAFDDHFHPKLPWAVANVGFDVLFLVEVYIAMRTGYYLDGMVVLEPAAVRSHYLHTRFALDLFGAARSASRSLALFGLASSASRSTLFDLRAALRARPSWRARCAPFWQNQKTRCSSNE